MLSKIALALILLSQIKAQIYLNIDNFASICKCNPAANSNNISLFNKNISLIDSATFNGMTQLELLDLGFNSLSTIV